MKGRTEFRSLELLWSVAPHMVPLLAGLKAGESHEALVIAMQKTGRMGILQLQVWDLPAMVENRKLEQNCEKSPERTGQTIAKLAAESISDEPQAQPYEPKFKSFSGHADSQLFAANAGTSGEQNCARSSPDGDSRPSSSEGTSSDWFTLLMWRIQPRNQQLQNVAEFVLEDKEEGMEYIAGGQRHVPRPSFLKGLEAQMKRAQTREEAEQLQSVFSIEYMLRKGQEFARTAAAHLRKEPESAGQGEAPPETDPVTGRRVVRIGKRTFDANSLIADSDQIVSDAAEQGTAQNSETKTAPRNSTSDGLTVPIPEGLRPVTRDFSGLNKGEFSFPTLFGSRLLTNAPSDIVSIGFEGDRGKALPPKFYAMPEELLRDPLHWDQKAPKTEEWVNIIQDWQSAEGFPRLAELRGCHGADPAEGSDDPRTSLAADVARKSHSYVMAFVGTIDGTTGVSDDGPHDRDGNGLRRAVLFAPDGCPVKYYNTPLTAKDWDDARFYATRNSQTARNHE